MSDVRVRIAPSPSGFLHIGTAKIALMNWLFARKTGGAFILRLEDTDAARTEEEFAQAMCDGFKWLGIDWDEGPPFGDEPQKGDRGPYRQSLRGPMYRSAIERLLQGKKAYACYCSAEEIEEKRELAKKEKRNPNLCAECRDLARTNAEVDMTKKFAVRFWLEKALAPYDQSDRYTFTIDDIVQGPVTIVYNKTIFQDPVIARSSGDALFHLAVVVDDGEMGISHVIRGDDHMNNAFLHRLLFEALGYPLPKFAHLPLVHDERGKKFSKRDHGANVLDWRRDGYLPEALVNYVVLLGWSAGDDRELYTREELIQAFSLERLGKSAGRFDIKRLQWLNGQHMRLMPAEALRDLLVPILQRDGFDTSSKSPEWLARMAAICQEKLATLNDISKFVDFFFQDVTEYEEKAVKKQWEKDGAAERLERIRAILEGVEPWEHDSIKGAVEREAVADGTGLGPFVHSMRLALTGKSVGPGLFELTELLGKDESLARIDHALGYVRGLTVS